MKVSQYKAWFGILHLRECLKTDQEIELIIKMSLPRQLQSLCQDLEDLDAEFEINLHDDLFDLIKQEREYQNGLEHMFNSLVKIAGGAL